jgi:hypothetical protein
MRKAKRASLSIAKCRLLFKGHNDSKRFFILKMPLRMHAACYELIEIVKRKPQNSFVVRGNSEKKPLKQSKKS